jgi:hypothetical protein
LQAPSLEYIDSQVVVVVLDLGYHDWSVSQGIGPLDVWELLQALNVQEPYKPQGACCTRTLTVFVFMKAIENIFEVAVLVL